MRVYRCDHCGEVVDIPIEICYPILPDNPDDEDEDDIEWAHLCNWQCLVSWAMSTAYPTDP